MLDTASVTKTPGKKRAAALQNIVYFARRADILTLPTVPEAPTTYAESVTIADDVVFQTGKKWERFQNTLETPAFTENIVGARDSKAFEGMLTLQAAGSADGNVLGFIGEHVNDDLIFLARHTDGTLRLIGSDGFAAVNEEGEMTSGNAIADETYSRFVFKTVGVAPSPIYTGAITETPAA